MLKDADIREPLFDFLEERYGKNRIIEEKMMGRSRADIVMVLPDCLVGIEIKSDADTYVRLSSQIKDYDKHFDYNMVVVGGTHATHISEHIPDYWGIITVEEMDGKEDFYVLREPIQNPKAKLEKKLTFMWRMELAQLQDLHEMPKYKNLSKDSVIKKIIERTKYPQDKKGYIETEVLQKEISNILFERDYSTVSEKIAQYRKENNLKPRRKRKRYRVKK